MEVLLSANAADVLELRDIERFSDGSFAARLVVRSRGFAVERPFYFDGHGLRTFLADLEAMDRTLSGVARLQVPHEDDFIQLRASSMGAIIASGSIHEHSDLSQVLQFSFSTDQTCLKPLARQVRPILELHAA